MRYLSNLYPSRCLSDSYPLSFFLKSTGKMIRTSFFHLLSESSSVNISSSSDPLQLFICLLISSLLKSSNPSSIFLSSSSSSSSSLVWSYSMMKFIIPINRSLSSSHFIPTSFAFSCSLFR